MKNFSLSFIQFIQSVLKKMGYYSGNIDGIIGPITKDSIIKFQKENNLPKTGVLDELTIKKLEPYYLGYIKYIIKPKDTLYSIGKIYNTSVNSILTANPGINPFLLKIGQEIIVPLNTTIVPKEIKYTYEILELNLKALKNRYPFIDIDVIGKSVDNRNIYRIRIGKGKHKVHYNASHHANEWITTPLLLSWLERFLYVYSLKGSIRGYNTVDIWNNSTIDIIPMVNPDGVELVVNGLENITVNRDKILSWNNGISNFNNWKANINGVDLNRNYPAGFDDFKKLEKEFGITGPGPALYAGDFPGSEPETKAMIDLTNSSNYRLVLAYHTQGEVIFWNYKNLQPQEAYNIALAFSKASGYALETPTLAQSYGGYKDFFIEKFRKPGYTIEVGKGINPLPISQFPTIYEDNEELLLLASVI